MNEASRANIAASRPPGIGHENSQTLTLQKLERHLWGAADLLRGKIDSSDYKLYILGLMFYKSICDVWQEESRTLQTALENVDPQTTPQLEHRFHIPQGAFWDDIKQHRHRIGAALNRAFQRIEANNPALKGIFRGADFDHPERFSDHTLLSLLEHFDRVPLGRRGYDGDLLGQAYEVLIARFADDAGKKGGEFYTPKPVGQLLVECLAPKERMSIYDPTCGSGGMLLEAVHHLRRHDQEATSLRLYGQEMNLNTWAICKINLFLHGIDDASILRGDTLRHPGHLEAEGSLMRFDRVLANPPFSLRNWGYAEWQQGDRFGRDVYGCPPRTFGEFAFVQHMIQSLAPEGRLAVVLPHGALFRGGLEKRIRRRLLRDDLIEAIIGLPKGLFYGTSISACALFIRNAKPASQKNRVLFIDGSGEVDDSQGNSVMTRAHIARIANAFKAFEEEAGFANVVSLDYIAAQAYDLSIGRYLTDELDEEVMDVSFELQIYRELCERRNRAEDELLRLLSTLSHDL